MSFVTSRYNFMMFDFKPRHNYGTRSNDTHLKFQPKTRFGQNSFLVSAVNIHNKLKLNQTLIASEDFNESVKGMIIQMNGNDNIV